MKISGKLLSTALAALAVIQLSCASPTRIVMGEEARSLLPPREELSDPGKYLYTELVNRKDHKLQLVVFNRNEGEEHSGKFEWARKEKATYSKYLPDTLNVILLDSPGGKPGKEPTKELFERIEAAHLVPVVVFGAAGGIRAVVYKPASVGVKVFELPGGVLRLELGRRAAGRYDINYSLQLI